MALKRWFVVTQNDGVAFWYLESPSDPYKMGVLVKTCWCYR